MQAGSSYGSIVAGPDDDDPDQGAANAVVSARRGE